MDEWWLDPETEICTFYIPVGGGESHVLTLHARQGDLRPWEYAIIQWWHKSPTLWLLWEGADISGSSPDLHVQLKRPYGTAEHIED